MGPIPIPSVVLVIAGIAPALIRTTQSPQNRASAAVVPGCGVSF